MVRVMKLPEHISSPVLVSRKQLVIFTCLRFGMTQQEITDETGQSLDQVHKTISRLTKLQLTRWDNRKQIRYVVGRKHVKGIDSEELSGMYGKAHGNPFIK